MTTDESYLVRVVQVQQPALRLINALVAGVHAANHERGIHVHVVAREVQRDEALEQDGEARERRREEDEQAGGGAAVGHHVKHGAEARRLLEVTRSVAVQRVEELRDAVEERARARVEGHVVEGPHGEDDAGVAWRELLAGREVQEQVREARYL